MQRRVLSLLGLLVAVAALSGCGSQSVETQRQAGGLLAAERDATVLRGAQLFNERCSGCHTFNVAGTQGGATKIKDREKVDGPAFNDRAETRADVLYALRNGGFSGAVMPANIAVGADAEALADFLCKYSGSEIEQSASPEKPLTPAQRCRVQTPDGATSSGSS